MAEIYIITNSKNGNRYIGKTINTKEQRFAQHLASAKNGCQTRLAKAIRKYGKNVMIIETLEEVLDDLNDREIYYIANLKPEYNMTAGGDGGVPTSPETKALLSRKAKKRFETSPGTFNGRKHTEESKLKNSIAHRGPNYEKLLLEKNRPKLDKSKTNSGKNNPFAGKTHTDIAKAKMSLYRLGKQIPDDVRAKLSIASTIALSKPYIVISPTGVWHHIKGLKTFCLEHGLAYSTLHATIRSGIPVRSGQSIGWLVKRL